MKLYEPYDYQIKGINLMFSVPRGNYFAKPGMGKTSAALYALAIWKLQGRHMPALIFGTKRIATEVWPKELKKWSCFKHLTCSVLSGKKPEQRAKAFFTTADIYTANYELMPWIWEMIKQSNQKEPWFKTIICDESTFVKNYRANKGGRRALAFSYYAFKSEKYFNLSGTPIPNGVKDFWGQMYFVDGGQRLGKTYSSFERRWYYCAISEINKDFKKKTPFPHAKEEISDLISDVTVTVRSEDYFNLKEPIIRTINSFLPDNARKAYKAMEKNLYYEFSQGPIEAFNAGVKTGKLLQMSSGGIYYPAEIIEVIDKKTGEIKKKKLRNSKFEKVHESKLDALEDIIEECGGENILVSYYWQFDLEMLKERFPQGVSINTKGAISNWDAGKIPLLFAHPKSAGHGLDLQNGGRILVNYSFWWSAEQRGQILERIGPMRQLQSGYNRNVLVYNIVSEGTIDGLALSEVDEKISIQELVLEYLKNKY